MVMWKLKGCPRCGGDLFSELREGEPYMQCLQCSYTQSFQPMYAANVAKRSPYGQGAVQSSADGSI